MKLVGNIGSVEIRFDFYPPETFKAIIPKRLDGKYMLELKIIDDAGNVNCSTGIYMYLDFQHMKFKVLNNKYEFKKDDNKLKYIKIESIYTAKELESKLIFKKNYSPYSYKELIL